jgi:two-component system OmpR family response regulator
VPTGGKRTPKSQVTVLVVGDRERTGEIVAALKAHACEVHLGDDPGQLSHYCDRVWPDAVVMEARAPYRRAALDSLEWARRLGRLPVVLITEVDDVDARLRSVTLRADDAVAPAAPLEIVGRVAALVREARRRGHEIRPLGDLTVDREGRQVSRRGTATTLTHRELQVLEVLIERPGVVVPKDVLLDRVWSRQGRSPNAVEAQISGLRRKIDSLGPPVIHTAHGEGYVFRPSVADEVRQGSAAMDERERAVGEREEAVARRTKILRHLEENAARRDRGMSERD